MIIRQADENDIPTIARIHARSWQDTYRGIVPVETLDALTSADWEPHWLEQLQSAATTTSVVEVDNTIVGFSSWELCPQASPTTGFLHSLYLLPTAKGNGIGTQLLQTVEAQMSAANATIGALHVVVGNTPAVKFYERRGWQRIDDSHEIEQFLGIDLNTVTYTKSVS